MNAARPISSALACQPALTAAIDYAQVKSGAFFEGYPLHYAVWNKQSEAVVMALLGTHPGEAKKLDEVCAAVAGCVQGAHPSHTRRRALPVAPPFTPRHRDIYSFARLHVATCVLWLPLPCAAW